MKMDSEGVNSKNLGQEVKQTKINPGTHIEVEHSCVVIILPR